MVAGSNRYVIDMICTYNANLRIFCNRQLLFQWLHCDSGALLNAFLLSTEQCLGGSFSQMGTEAAPRWSSKRCFGIVVSTLKSRCSSPSSSSSASCTTPASLWTVHLGIGITVSSSASATWCVNGRLHIIFPRCSSCMNASGSLYFVWMCAVRFVEVTKFRSVIHSRLFLARHE